MSRYLARALTIAALLLFAGAGLTLGWSTGWVLAAFALAAVLVFSL